MRDQLFMAAVRAMPRQQMTRVAGALSGLPVPKLARAPIYGLFARAVGVNMRESAHDYAAFPTFNAFFSRALKEGARPWQMPSDAWAIPADGVLSMQGRVQKGEMIQVKGRSYDVGAFLGDDATRWENARYATIYLSPAEYHRVHWPTSGTVRRVTHMGGDLWPVNETSVRHVPQLFIENERTVTEITDEKGRSAAVVMVGATIVGGIDLAVPEVSDVDKTRVQAGDEHGKFLLGSTVVLVVQDATQPLERVYAEEGTFVHLGQALWS